MATCPPDRACATPTPSQAKARPSGIGNPTLTEPGTGESCWDETAAFPAVLQSRGWTQPEQETCQAKPLGAAALTDPAATLPGKENKPCRAGKCWRTKPALGSALSAFPKPKRVSGESGTVRCLHTDRQTAQVLLSQGHPWDRRGRAGTASPVLNPFC